MQFLIGLNDTFSIVRTPVLLMDPLPSINHIYSFVTQDESHHKTIALVEDTFILVNVVHTIDFKHKGGSYNTKNAPRVCTFCNRIGHTFHF